MRFEPVRPRRLAEDIADKIRAFILEGSLRPGDRLPAERSLAEQFETSRPTIRDALMQLEQEGCCRCSAAACMWQMRRRARSAIPRGASSAPIPTSLTTTSNSGA